MKLTSLILVITILQVKATSYAQNISLKVKNAPLEEVFISLRQQSGYNFLYDPDVLNQTKKVSLSVTNAPLKEVLDKCFKNQPISYVITLNNIVIQKISDAPVKAGILDEAQQNITVTGTVTDSKGQPIPGVTVTIKGTTKGVIANADGKYSISLPDGNSILIFSSIGFVTQEVNVNNKGVINIKLKDQQSSFNEIVVVGYGTAKKATLTGSVSTLDMKTKENTPTTNASQALHGVSGVWVNQNGGQPGLDAGSIRIRGVGSIGAAAKNDPLVLVDGIEYNLNEINPDFIESITVLKDASAAIYGVRAANGVILVTTKKGKKGITEVNYNFTYSNQTPTYLPDVVWDPIQYMQLRDQALINEGKAAAAVDYSPAQIAEYQAGMATDPLTYPNINWFDIIFKHGYMQQHNLRFSGGNDAVIYNVGIGYQDQDGILIKANHGNRYTFNTNVSANVSSKLKIGANIIGNYRTYTQPSDNPAPAPSTNAATTYYMNRFYRVLPIFGTYTNNGTYSNSVFSTPGRNSPENPLQIISEGSNVSNEQRILAKFEATYQLPFNISYNLNYGIDKQDGFFRAFVPYLVTYNPKTYVPNIAVPNPASNNWDSNILDQSFYQTLNWDKKIGTKHTVGLLLGSSFNKFDNKNFKGHVEGYFDNTLSDLSAGSTLPAVTGNLTFSEILSYFGRFNYSFSDKYLFEATARYDGSSRFAEGKRWGFFPAVSGAWRLDKEGFLKDSKTINLLKLRGSWGRLGNQDAVNLYSYLNTVNLGQDYSFNNTISSGAAVTAYTDPSITWETTTTTDIGLDAEAWQGKLGMVLDVFRRRTSDILRAVTIPGQVGGLTGPTKNIGVVDNSGFEIGLTHRNTINKFTYEIDGSVSFVKNKVINLNGETIISGTGNRRITKEGYPIDSYYLYQADGIYQTQAEVNASPNLGAAVKPGYVKYKDVSGPNGVPDGKIDGNDRIIVGHSAPAYTYSFNINMGYSRVSLSAFFQGVQGIDLYPTLNLAYPFNNGAGVTQEWATESWTPANPTARLPILTTATNAPENFQASTLYLKDASYLRLKELQFRYELPLKWISRISVKKVTLFVNGENLLTFTKFKGYDPEKDTADDTFYDYPSLKTYSFGINATF